MPQQLSDDHLKTKTKFRSAKKLWVIIPRTSRFKLFLLSMMMVIGVLLEVLGIGLLVPVINLLTSDQTSPSRSILDPTFSLFGATTKSEMLMIGFMFISLTVLLKNLFLLYVNYFQQKFVNNIWNHLQIKLFNSYTSSNYSFHLNSNSSILLRNMTSEIDQVTERVLLPMISMFVEIFVVIGIAALLLYRELLGSLALVAFFTICGLAYTKLINPPLIKFGDQKTKLKNEYLKKISETIGAIKQIKVLGREEYFCREFMFTSRKIAAANTVSGTLQSIPPLLVEFWGVLGLAVVIMTMLVRNFDQSTMIPTLALFVGASYRFVPALNRIFIAVGSLKYSSPSIDIVYSEVVEKNPKIEREKQVLDFNDSLEFRDVSFAYDNETTNVISDISLTIHAGQTIGIIGQSGAGKSTLVDLLLGLLKPTTGQIQVDGKIVDLENSTWRSNAGYVPQQIFLIDDTIQANIAFGIDQKDISKDRLLQSVALTRLDKLIGNLPKGIFTSVGERGIRISGGQRQRVGIARALYQKPSILVLDEATSALDLESEEELLRELEQLYHKLTIVMISHRMSALNNCDRIFQLINGQLIEFGV